MSALVIGLAVFLVVVAALAAGGLVRKYARRDSSDWYEALTRADRARETEQGPLLNVDIPAPAPESPFALTCPHCSFDLPLEDLSLIGESVQCPLCEELFLVLEPEAAAGVGDLQSPE